MKFEAKDEPGLTPGELAAELRFSDVQWAHGGRFLIWREERSDRGVLVRLDLESGLLEEVARGLPVRACVGYGGGDFAASGEWVYFVSGGGLYRESVLDGGRRMLTPPGGAPASPVPSPDGRRLAFVRSCEEADSLSLVAVGGQDGVQTVDSEHDFYMQPCWHPSGERLAWVAWDHPHMPWDETVLEMARLQGPTRVAVERTAGGKGCGESLFQPGFSPDGRFLSFVSDAGGWFNLKLLDLFTGRTWTPVAEEAEHGLAAWVQGMRTYAWAADGRLFLIRQQGGFCRLLCLDVKGREVEEVRGLENYTSLRQICCGGDPPRLALLASSPSIPERVLVLESASGSLRVCRRSSRAAQRSEDFSQPRPVDIPGEGRTLCRGLFYPPRPSACSGTGPPPAIIKVHGGPTSHFAAAFQAETQFLTGLGFAVLELNYRGSAGYGRRYRESLYGRWGLSDVEDVEAAAAWLTGQGLSHPRRLVVMGGSAGGFTALLALIRHPGRFAAGVCRYPVADLSLLARDTHKFERHYLDSLIGPPQQARLYRERSPLTHIDQIRDPLALFQGEEDPVVPHQQSDAIARALEQRGVPLLYRLYPGEGHGWKKSETIEDYYRTLAGFLKRHLLGKER